MLVRVMKPILVYLLTEGMSTSVWLHMAFHLLNNMFASVIESIFCFSLLQVVSHFIMGFPTDWDEYAAKFLEDDSTTVDLSGITSDSGEFANHPRSNICTTSLFRSYLVCRMCDFSSSTPNNSVKILTEFSFWISFHVSLFVQNMQLLQARKILVQLQNKLQIIMSRSFIEVSMMWKL